MFGEALEIDISDEKIVYRERIPVAVDCWFTASGKAIPRMIKVKQTSGSVESFRIENVRTIENKIYLGVRLVRFHVQITDSGILRQFWLCFQPENISWFIWGNE